MQVPDENLSLVAEDSLDERFRAEVERLYHITLYGRWCVAGVLWLTLGSLSLWNLRGAIALMREYFTWASLRYGLMFHPWAAIGLGLCVGMTLSVMIWQSRNIICGLPQAEQKQLRQTVCKIRQQGVSHPLWKWVCQETMRSQ